MTDLQFKDPTSSPIVDSRSRVTTAVWLTAAILWVGCAASPTRPERASTARGIQADDEFVPVEIPEVAIPDPVGGGPTSLDSILAYADRHAPRLLVARQRLRLGDAAVVGASPMLPQNPVISVAAGPRLSSDGTHADLAGSISQRVEIAGERGRRIDAAEHTQQRLGAELDEVRWDVHRDVHAAFHRTLVARERLAAAERLLVFQERLVDITRRRLRAGDVSPLAVRLTEAELSQSRVAKIAKTQDYLRERLELGALAGWPTSHPPEPVGQLDDARDPPSREDLASAARRHQPRLRTLHAARQEAQSYARSADREAWVKPTVGVQVTREGAPSGMAETIVLGTLSVPIPLVQNNQGPRATAHAQVRIAEAEQDAFGLQLESRIEQHRTSLVAAAASVRTYGGEILPSFEQNLHLIERAFELGEIDILQVTVARERFLRIQSAALDAYSAYFRAVADLEASVGTDLWGRDQHHQDPSDNPKRSTP